MRFSKTAIMNITPWGENSKELVLSFEQQIGFALPEDYRQFLIKNNGAVVNQQAFFVKDLGQEVLLDVMYGLTNANARSLTLAYWLKEYEGEIGEKELVIGSDPGGHQILFITSGADKGVYYWDTNHFFAQSSKEEGDTYFLAASFSEFCELLTDYHPAQTDK